MNVLITGATGFIGRQLVRELLADGHQVTVLTRNPSAAERALPVRCGCVAWNPETGLIDRDCLRSVDAVVHLAGEGIAAGRWSAARKQAIRDSRVGGTRLLVDSIAALPASERPRALISGSAIGYYGDRGDEPLDEQSSAGSDFLAQVCAAWEQEARRAESLGVRVAVLRIGVVLGSGGGALRQLLPPLQVGLGGRLGSGRQWMSWIHLGDLTRLLRFALTNDAASGAINAVAPESATNADFTRILARTLGRPAILPVPAFALRAAMGEMAAVLLSSQRVLPRAAERLGFQFVHGELSSAFADLCADLSEQFDMEQWVPHTPDAIFSFFGDARNLELLTPEFLRFRVVGVTTPTLQTGTLIDYRLSLHGVPVRWQSRIERWEPNRTFADVQVRGPYKLWQHTHEFEPYNGGTIIRDRIRYALPLAPLGALVAGRMVARDLRAIFDYRRAQVATRFGSSTSRATE